MILKDYEYIDEDTGVKFYLAQDVKKAVLSFEMFLNSFMTETETYELTAEESLEQFREIFGDFEK